MGGHPLGLFHDNIFGCVGEDSPAIEWSSFVYIKYIVSRLKYGIIASCGSGFNVCTLMCLLCPSMSWTRKEFCISSSQACTESCQAQSVEV